MTDSAISKKGKLKIFLAIIVGAMVALAMFGCASQQSSSSSSSSEASSSSSSSSEASQNDSSSASSTSTASSNEKTLVVYYSATGNTAKVADEIAKVTGSVSFEIVPAENYTNADLDYNDSASRVSREYADESLRDVKLKSTKVENWDDYTTVYIGYPIWWGMAAWPVDSFVKANDFTGKTVIPFCTSSSSGIGSSAKDLAKLAKGGTWLDGKRFSGNATEAEVKEWINSL